MPRRGVDPGGGRVDPGAAGWIRGRQGGSGGRQGGPGGRQVSLKRQPPKDHLPQFVLGCCGGRPHPKKLLTGAHFCLVFMSNLSNWSRSFEGQPPGHAPRLILDLPHVEPGRL